MWKAPVDKIFRSRRGRNASWFCCAASLHHCINNFFVTPSNPEESAGTKPFTSMLICDCIHVVGIVARTTICFSVRFALKGSSDTSFPEHRCVVGVPSSSVQKHNKGHASTRLACLLTHLPLLLLRPYLLRAFPVGVRDCSLWGSQLSDWDAGRERRREFYLYIGKRD